MIHTFKCPSCGALLKFDDHAQGAADRAEATTLRCEYCGLSTPIPEAFRPKQAQSSGNGSGQVPRRISAQAASEIQQLVLRGNKIGAIKVLREHTGLSLKSSKDAIDAIADGDTDLLNDLLMIHEAYPTQPTTAININLGSFSTSTAPPTVVRSSGGGCLGTLFSLIILAGILIGIGAAIGPSRLGLPNTISVGPLKIPLNSDGPISIDGTDVPGLPGQSLLNTNAWTYDQLSLNSGAQLTTIDDQPQPNLIGTAYHIGDNKWQVAFIDSAQNKVVWRADADTQSTFIDSPEAVIVASKTQLMALDRATGVPRWVSNLSDAISGSCDACLALAGDRVIVLSNDSVLQSFDVKTGKKMWSLTLAVVTPRFYVWGDKVVAIDRNEAVRGFSTQARVIDPSGQVQTQFDLTCSTPRTEDSVGGDASAYPYSAMEFDARAGALYAWYGGFSSCVQKWDLASGTATWTTELAADPPEHDDAMFVQRENTLFMGGADQVFAVDVTTGQATELVAENGDYSDITPIDEHDGVLVVEATRTRGTRRLELWGIEVAGGKKLWDLKFGEGGMMGGSPGRDGMSGFVRQGSDGTAWTAHVVPSGELVLLRVSGQPELQMTVETLNLKDGTSKGQTAIPLNKGDTFFSAPRVLGWRNDTVWLFMDNQYLAVDTAAPRITFKTP